MPVLQGESRLEETVQESLGKAAFVVWSAARLDSISGGMAATDSIFRPRCQLRPGP